MKFCVPMFLPLAVLKVHFVLLKLCLRRRKLVREVKFGQKFVTGKVKSQNIKLEANETKRAKILSVTHSRLLFFGACCRFGNDLQCLLAIFMMVMAKFSL